MIWAKKIYRSSYFSTMVIPLEAQAGEIAAIVSESGERNRQQNITGALTRVKNYFVQILEGPEVSVLDTLQRIKRDPRHKNLCILHAGLFKSRLFDGWSLEFAEMNSNDGEACNEILEKAEAGNHLDVELIETMLLRWSKEA